MDLLPEPAIATTDNRTYGGNRAFHNFHNDYSHIQDPNLRRRLALSEVCQFTAKAGVVGIGMGLELMECRLTKFHLAGTMSEPVS